MAVLLSQTAALGVGQANETEVANLNVHNGRFIYSAGEKQGEFNLALYLNANAPWLDPYRELITHWCGFSTVSPRIALALIELQTGLVSTDVPSPSALRRPFGDLSSRNTFNGQAEDVLRRLSASFYANAPGSSGQLRNPDAARRALVSLLGSENRLSDFHRSFQRIFPELGPLPQGPNSPRAPKSTPPADFLQLPFPIGDSWVFNGAHSNLGRDPGPRSSIDFSRNWTQWGVETPGNTVVAAAAGTAIVHSRCLVEVLSSNGWSTSYYHMGNIVVNSGTFVRKDQRLGTYANVEQQALCRGDAPGPHVQFSLLSKGEYISLHNVLLSGYRVDVGRSSYDDDCAHFYLERNGVRHCAGTPIINQSGSTLPPPSAPDGLQATPQSNSEINLAWQDESSTESGFEIERGQAGSFTRVGIVGQGITSFRDSGLASGSSYDYRVRAVNDAGASAYSTVVSARTQGERMPTGLSAVAAGVDAIELSWTDRAETEDEYQIEGRSAGDNSFSLYQRLPANSESARIEGLLPQTTYTFRVRANGTNGVSTYTAEATATTFNETPGPCEASDTSMCLSQGRFRVEVDWQRFDGVRGDARRVTEGTDDSGLFWFFQQQNWEMLVKVLDGCGVNENFWVFAAATTNVEYTLRVTDTATGQVKTYFNELGRSAPAITDTQAFATCGTQAANAETDALVGTVSWTKEEQELSVLSTPTAAQLAASPKTGDTSPCVESASRLCLNDGRFELTVTWEDFRGSAGTGQTAPLRSDDSGLFWFFNNNNWEMLAKIVDGCELNDHYWIFAASTTNVAYRLSVRDTVTGTVREYANPLGRSAAAITDSEALAVCP